MRMKNKKITFISIACAGAVFVIALICVMINVFAFYLPAKRKREETEKFIREYYQTHVEAFIEENKTLSNVDVVFLGDSLTEGYNLSQYYPEYTAVNRGIGGDTTFGLENRLQVSAYDLSPKVVCMLIGGNNLSTMFQNYEQILIELKENLPNANVVLLSLTAMGGVWARNNPLAIENNQRIKSMAEYYQFEFVDLFTPLYDYKTGEIKDGLSIDGVHFSEDGYTIVTNQIKPILENLLS